MTKPDLSHVSRDALEQLLRKLLIEDETGYISRPIDDYEGGYSFILDHSVSITKDEAELVNLIRSEIP